MTKDRDKIKKNKSIYLYILCLTAVCILMMFSYEVGFRWGNIQGSMQTMNYCMLQNLTSVS